MIRFWILILSLFLFLLAGGFAVKGCIQSTVVLSEGCLEGYTVVGGDGDGGGVDSGLV